MKIAEAKAPVEIPDYIKNKMNFDFEEDPAEKAMRLKKEKAQKKEIEGIFNKLSFIDLAEKKRKEHEQKESNNNKKEDKNSQEKKEAEKKSDKKEEKNSDIDVNILLITIRKTTNQE